MNNETLKAYGLTEDSILDCLECGWRGSVQNLTQTDAHTADLGLCPECDDGVFAPVEVAGWQE